MRPSGLGEVHVRPQSGLVVQPGGASLASLGEVLLVVEIGEVVLVLLSCLTPLSVQGPAYWPLERLLSNQYSN